MPTEKRKIGRPVVVGKDFEFVTVRFKRAVAHRLTEVAKSETGCRNRSDYIRKLAMQALENPPVSRAETRRALGLMLR